jgi:hypothetical protein
MLARDLVPPIGEVKGGFEDSQHTVSGRAPLSYCSGLLGSKGRPVSFLALAFFLALGFFALLSAIFFWLTRTRGGRSRCYAAIPRCVQSSIGTTESA